MHDGNDHRWLQENGIEGEAMSKKINKRRCQRLTLNVQSGLIEIIDDLADALGITRKEAALHFLRNDALDWWANVMSARKRTERHDHET